MKFLIIRFSSIGDIVLATPLVRCLRKKFPSAEIDFAVKEQNAGVLSGNPHISNIIPCKNSIFDIIAKLRAQKYDYVLDIHGNFRSFIVSLFLGGKILKSRRYLLERFMLTEFGINLFGQAAPVAGRYLGAASRLGVEADGLGTEFYIDKNIKNQRGVPPGIYAGLCPVSVWNTKRWPAENFIELGKKIAAKSGCGILIFGGPRDAEYCEGIKKSIGGPAFNLCCASIQETAFYLTMCRVLVTSDTGVMHVADALKIPVIALFGPTVKEFGFYPQGAASKVISVDLSCRPCSTKGSRKCPVGNFRCMKGISAEEVFSHCASYL